MSGSEKITEENTIKNTEENTIKVLVANEEDLYNPFNPDSELSDALKTYIRAKAAELDNNRDIHLTVISHTPIDEDRFQSAVSNWIKSEKAVFKSEEKDTFRTLIGLIAFGSLFLTFSVAIVNKNYLLKYSLLPIIGSLALSRAARIMILELPIIRAKKWIIGQMEKNNAISFEYLPE